MAKKEHAKKWRKRIFASGKSEEEDFKVNIRRKVLIVKVFRVSGRFGIRDIVPGEDGQKVWDAVKKYQFGSPMSDEQKDSVCMILVPYLAEMSRIEKDYSDVCVEDDFGHPDAAGAADFSSIYGISPDDVESFADDAFEKRLCLSSVIGFLFDAYGDVVPPQKYFELAAKEASRLGFAIEKCSAAKREVWLAKKYDVRSLVPVEERSNVWHAIEMLALGGYLSDAEKDRFWDMIIPSLSKANKFFEDYQAMCLDKRKKAISVDGVIALAKAYSIRPEDVEARYSFEMKNWQAAINVAHLFFDSSSDKEKFKKAVKKSK